MGNIRHLFVSGYPRAGTIIKLDSLCRTSKRLGVCRNLPVKTSLPCSVAIAMKPCIGRGNLTWFGHAKTWRGMTGVEHVALVITVWSRFIKYLSEHSASTWEIL